MDLSSTEVFPQLLVAVGTALLVYIIFMVAEILYKAYLSYGSQRVEVYPYTGSSSKSISFKQDPKNTANIVLPFSDNQMTGIEFSYSAFIYISDDTQDSTGVEGWKTIFYKGYETGPFPLCAPGVFVSNNPSNKGPVLRVVMNTYKTWYNTVDVAQIPFNKWFHLAIVLRNNSLEVYVNGNLANKLSFNGTLPYQNYQSLNLFSNARSGPATEFTSTNTTTKKTIPAGDNFNVIGKFSGYISSLTYFSYAISYSEIQKALTVGPSSKFDQSAMDKPPYLIDSWWTQRKA
jgi:hypothetical protein